MGRNKRGWRKSDLKKYLAATNGPDSNVPSEEMNDSVDASASFPPTNTMESTNSDQENPTNTMEPTDCDQQNVSTADAPKNSKMDQPSGPLEPINTEQTAAVTSGKGKEVEETPCVTCGARVKADKAKIKDLEQKVEEDGAKIQDLEQKVGQHEDQHKEDRAKIQALEQKVDQHKEEMNQSRDTNIKNRGKDVATLKQQKRQITQLEGALESEKDSRTAAEKLLEGQRTELQRLKTQLDAQAGSLAQTCLQLQDAEAKNRKSDEVVLLFKQKYKAQQKQIDELKGGDYARDASDAASSVAGDTLDNELFTAEEDATRQEEDLKKSEATTSSAGPSEKAQSMPSFLTKFKTGGEFSPRLTKKPKRNSQGIPPLGAEEDQEIINVPMDFPRRPKATEYVFLQNPFNKPTNLYHHISTQTTEDETTSQAAIPKDDLPLTTNKEMPTEEVKTAIPKDGSTQTEDAPTAILKNKETQTVDPLTTEATATQTPPIVPVPFYQRLSLQNWFFLLATCLLLLITLFTFYHGLQARSERAMWLAANDYSRRAVIYHRTASMRGQWVGWLTSSKMRELGMRHGRGFGKYGVEM